MRCSRKNDSVVFDTWAPVSNKQRTSTGPVLTQASGHSPTAQCRVEPALNPAVWPTTMGFTENSTWLLCCFLSLLLPLLDSCSAYDLLTHTPSKVCVHRVAVGDLFLAGIKQQQPSHQSVYSALASLLPVAFLKIASGSSLISLPEISILAFPFRCSMIRAHVVVLGMRLQAR